MNISLEEYGKLSDRITDLMHENERLRKIVLATQQWISVKDRLPEKGTDVIANSKICGVTPAFYDNDGTYYDLNGDGVRGITHWMPLPEPPEVEDASH